MFYEINILHPTLVVNCENAHDYNTSFMQFYLLKYKKHGKNLQLRISSMFFILHLSRTPVREALIELNKVGLVEIQPERGSCIAKIDYELIGESRFMRLMLENAVLKLACESISQEYMDKLKEYLRMETIS